VGIPDISHIKETRSVITDEIQAFEENADVIMIVMKVFIISCDVFVILRFDQERELPNISEVRDLIKLIQRGRYILNEISAAYRELSKNYELKIERIKNL